MTSDSVDGPESEGTYKMKCVVVGDSEVATRIAKIQYTGSNDIF